MSICSLLPPQEDLRVTVFNFIVLYSRSLPTLAPLPLEFLTSLDKGVRRGMVDLDCPPCDSETVIGYGTFTVIFLLLKIS